MSFCHFLSFQKLSEWPDRIVFIRDGVSEGMSEICVRFRSRSHRFLAFVFMTCFDIHSVVVDLCLGKMEDVCCHEVAAIKAVFTKGGHPDPDVTAFVAVKNHNTRFWDPKTQDVRSNLCPGTWIAESGVHPLKFPNFYLLSHAGIKGNPSTRLMRLLSVSASLV